MEVNDILLEGNTDDNIYYILDKYCNDDIKKLQMIDEMITILNNKKITLELAANKFYLNKDKYINNKFKRIFRRYILCPVLIFSGINIGLTSIISSKFIIFLIFCMLSLYFLIVRKIIPEINKVPIYCFEEEYNKYFTSIDEIDKMLILLCQARIIVGRKINENKKSIENRIKLSKRIEYEDTNKINKPYCRIRKRM